MDTGGAADASRKAALVCHESRLSKFSRVAHILPQRNAVRKSSSPSHVDWRVAERSPALSFACVGDVGVVEGTLVEISMDGINFSSLGNIGGETGGIDIDAFGFGPSDQFAFVRLRDDPADVGSCPPIADADIDAVGAISTIAVEPIPLPAAVRLFGSGLFGLAALARRNVARSERKVAA